MQPVELGILTIAHRYLFCDPDSQEFARQLDILWQQQDEYNNRNVDCFACLCFCPFNFNTRCINLDNLQVAANKYVSALLAAHSQGITQLPDILIQKPQLYLGEPSYPSKSQSVKAKPGKWITHIRSCTESVIHAHESMECIEEANAASWYAMCIGGKSMLGICDRIHTRKKIQGISPIELNLDGPYSLQCICTDHLIAIDAGEMRGRIALVATIDKIAVAIVYPSLLNNRVLDDDWNRKYKLDMCACNKCNTCTINTRSYDFVDNQEDI